MTDTLIPNGCKTNGPVESGYFKKVRVTPGFSVFLDVSGGDDKLIMTFIGHRLDGYITAVLLALY